MIDLQDSEKSPVPKTAHLRVNTGLSDLDHILSWFAQLHQSPIPTSLWIRCQLALAEGFTNAVRYAQKDLPPNTPIDIEVKMFPEHLEIRVWDHGPPFDFERKLKEVLNATTVDLYASGGRGLKLMNDIADHLSYTRSADERNCLLIVKQYPSPLSE